MCLCTVARIASEAVFDFAVKNTVHYYALDKVRHDLEEIITELVVPHLGSFFGSIVGNQLALFNAIPVTNILGGMWSFTLKEIIYSIYNLAKHLLGYPDPESATPVVCRMAIYFTSLAIGFYVKTLFANYGMPAVASAIRASVVLMAPLYGFTPPGIFISIGVVLATPSITAIVSDIFGTIAQYASAIVLEQTGEWVFRSL